MTMTFKQLIEEAAANKIPLSVTAEEKDGKTLATFTPATGEGRTFTAELDNYAVRIINHTSFAKKRHTEKKEPAADKTAQPNKSASPAPRNNKPELQAAADKKKNAGTVKKKTAKAK